MLAKQSQGLLFTEGKGDEVSEGCVGGLGGCFVVEWEDVGGEEVVGV